MLQSHALHYTLSCLITRMPLCDLDTIMARATYHRIFGIPDWIYACLPGLLALCILSLAFAIPSAGVLSGWATQGEEALIRCVFLDCRGFGG